MTRFQIVDTLPDRADGGWYADYEHRVDDCPQWTACELLPIFRRRNAAWMDDFDAWHAQLSAAASSRTRWWWLLPGSRPNLWVQQDVLRPLWFAAALSEWCVDHPQASTVYLVGCPPEVLEYLEEFRRAPRVARSAAARFGLRRLSGTVQALWRLIVDAMRQAVSLARRRAGRQLQASGAETVFYSHVIRTDAYAERGDHFFGSVMAEAGTAQGGVLAAYMVDVAEEQRTAEALLDRQGTPWVFVTDALMPADPWRAAAGAIRAGVTLAGLARTIPPIRLGAYASRGAARRYVTDCVLSQPGVVSLAVHRAMGRILKRTGARRLFYPYEEKPAERALIMACREARPPVTAAAFAHVAQTPAHLFLRTRQRPHERPPEPDHWLATGPAAKEFLTSWARKPAERVQVAGSPRYADAALAAPPAVQRQAGLRVLVLISHGHELTVLAHWIERHAGLFQDAEVVIRPYPFGWQAAQQRAIERIRRRRSSVQASPGRLDEQIAWSHAVVFCASTAGYEAILQGRLAAYADWNDLWDADPLPPGQEGIPRCADAGQLVRALAGMRALSDADYAARLDDQRRVAASVFAPSEWDAVLANADAAGRQDRWEALGIVIPTKDRPDALHRLLASIAAQSCQPGAIIVVDGGTAPVEPWPEACRGVTIRRVPVERPGLTRQKNIGVAALAPRVMFAAFLDDDIVLEPGALEAMRRFWSSAGAQVGGAAFHLAGSGPRLGAAQRLQRWCGVHDGSIGRVLPSGFNTPVAGAPATMRVDWINGGSSVWRREVLARYRFDEWFERNGWCEDVCFSLEAGREFQLMIVAEARARHDEAPLRLRGHLRLGRDQVVNRLHVLRHLPAASRARCWRALLGQLVINLGQGCAGSGAHLARAAGNLIGIGTAVSSSAARRCELRRTAAAPEAPSAPARDLVASGRGQTA